LQIHNENLLHPFPLSPLRTLPHPWPTGAEGCHVPNRPIVWRTRQWRRWHPRQIPRLQMPNPFAQSASFLHFNSNSFKPCSFFPSHISKSL
jgi:hypothetical protein